MGHERRPGGGETRTTCTPIRLAARSRVLLLGKKNLLASKIIFSLLLSARRISLTPPRRVRSRL